VVFLSLFLGYGQLLTRGFIQAIPWAIVFSVAWLTMFNVMLGMVRQDVKEAIEYGAKVGVSQAINTVLHDPKFDQELWPKIKQNTKEAIEYAVITANRQQATFLPAHARK